MRSYPKIYNLGNRIIENIFSEDVSVEEKIDGSQFSFGLNEEGDLICRSKSCMLNMVAPEKMFTRAVEVAQSIKDKLTPGWIYRTEYLAKPKHNTLHYARIPENHLIGFDIETGDQYFLDYKAKSQEFSRLGLETVTLMKFGKIETYDVFRDLVDNTTSILGGAKVEGVVVKNYNRFGPEGKIMIGKFVSEEFKESHRTEWKKTAPAQSDIIIKLGETYRTKARWNKAIQHLKEQGVLTTSLKDIPLLLKEISSDTKTECEDEIKQIVFDWVWGKVSRSIISGFPEYYKEYLIKESFNDVKTETTDT